MVTLHGSIWMNLITTFQFQMHAPRGNISNYHWTNDFPQLLKCITPSWQIQMRSHLWPIWITLREIQHLWRNVSHLKPIESVTHGGRSEHMAWYLDFFLYVWFSKLPHQNSSWSKLKMEKCSTPKLLPLISPFQKVQNNLIWINIEGLAWSNSIKNCMA